VDVRRVFTTLLQRAEKSGAALFACKRPSGDVDLFFTPSASLLARRLIQSVDGQACGPPPLEESIFVAGERAAWKLLA